MGEKGANEGGQSSFEHNPHDPTRGKLMVVATWLRTLISNIQRNTSDASTTTPRPLDVRRVNQALDELLYSWQGMHRVHSVYLPLPYCQLLKIIMYSWVFSLPFVLAQEMGTFLPLIEFLVALAFFGIDQVGAELEGPYGIDDNDLPLLHMGISLVDDLDIILRASEQSLRWEARSRQKQEQAARSSQQEQHSSTKGGIIAAASRGLASTTHVAVCWPRSHTSQAARSRATAGPVRSNDTAVPPATRAAPSTMAKDGSWDTLTTTCAPAVKL